MRILTVTLLLMSSFATAWSQKLPNVQQVSLRAPDNIKIDGKDKEWNGQFRAYNTTTDVFYTISNDTENLYIAIYANNIDIVSKMLRNGMKITFNAKKKSTDNSVTISYPIPPTPQEWKDLSTTLLAKPDIENEPFNRANELSTLKGVAQMHKRVSISGIESFTEPSYSIYDANDIMVRLNRPEKEALYFELSIPLKYLALGKSAFPKLNYNIRLNEHFLSRALPPEALSGKTAGGNEEGVTLYATDFWGEYTLAK